MDPNDVALLLITVIVDYMAILIVMKMTTILPEEMMLVMAIMIFQVILFLVLEREGEIQQVCVFQFNVQPVTWFVNMLFLITEHCKYNCTTELSSLHSFDQHLNRESRFTSVARVYPYLSTFLPHLPIFNLIYANRRNIQPNLCKQAQCGHLCFGASPEISNRHAQ